jgi:hypothetical protein
MSSDDDDDGGASPVFEDVIIGHRTTAVDAGADEGYAPEAVGLPYSAQSRSASWQFDAELESALQVLLLLLLLPPSLPPDNLQSRIATTSQFLTSIPDIDDDDDDDDDDLCAPLSAPPPATDAEAPPPAAPASAPSDSRAALRKCVALAAPLHRLHVTCLLALCILKQRLSASDACVSFMRSLVPNRSVAPRDDECDFRLHICPCSISRRLHTVVIDGPDADASAVGALACWFQATSMCAVISVLV